MYTLINNIPYQLCIKPKNFGDVTNESLNLLISS